MLLRGRLHGTIVQTSHPEEDVRDACQWSLLWSAAEWTQPQWP